MKLSSFGGHPIAMGLSESTARTASAAPNNGLIRKLDELGIKDYEQLYALVKNEKSKSPLRDQLNASDAQLNTLFQESIRVVDEFTLKRIDSLSEIDFPIGALPPKEQDKPVDDLFEIYLPQSSGSARTASSRTASRRTASSQVAKRLATIKKSVSAPPPVKQINYVRQLPRVRNQADRGTCVSFAVTCINEFTWQKKGVYPDLSEQHLYFETKAIDGSPAICGTWVSKACQVLAAKGQCQETVWSYNPNPPCNQVGKPAGADPDALSYKRTGVNINPNNVPVIKNFLAKGNLVAFAIPVFPSWINSGETARSGRITMPLPGERSSGGHAMALVGYQDEPGYPGGGYFILRNSWGEQWGAENAYAPGYGIIPYAFIAKHNWEAFAVA